MKHLRILVFVFTMAFYTLPCSAQYEEYYKVGAETYVTTAPKVELYEFPPIRYNIVYIKMPHLKPYRDFVDIQGCGVQKVKKPTQLKVIRFANTVKQQGFNAYVVEYKNRVWLLDCVNVQDNTIINERNTQIINTKRDLESQKQSLEAQQQALNQEKQSIDNEIESLISQRRKEYTDSLNYYKALKECLPKLRDSLLKAKTNEEQSKANKAHSEWYNALPASAKKAAGLISITDLGLSEPNSVGGCDYTLCFINNSKKVIKYLHWTGTVYNRVNDPAYCQIRRTATYRGVDTGPYAQGEEGGGCWENVVYNHAADTLKISSISITYMDGATASIAAADIRRLAEEPSTDIYVSSYDVNKTVISDWTCRDKISYWNSMLNKLEDTQHTMTSSNMRYREVKTQIYNVGVEIRKLNERIRQIDKFINFDM